MRSNVIFRKCWGNYLSELERPLASIGFKYEEGIYTKASLLPFYYKYDDNCFSSYEIESPTGEILVPRESLDYNTLTRNYIPLYSSRDAVLKFYSHDWEVNTCSTVGLTLHPRVPCLGMVLVKSLIATANHRTRAYSYSSSETSQRDFTVEEILTEALEIEMEDYYKDSALFYSVYEYVREILFDSTRSLIRALSQTNLRWNVLDEEFNYDESIVLAAGDYRVIDWMLNHERTDW